MRIMVLGANGYLGKKIIGCLAESHSVTGVYRRIPEKTEKVKQIDTSLDSIRRILGQEHYDWIVNCAAVYEHPGTMMHEVVDANMIFALRVLNCAIECGVQKFLTVDTGLPKELNLYSFTKKSFAEFGEFYSKKYRITFVNVLLELFYGADEPEGRFLSDICRKMARGEEIDLTAGTQKRDIIHVDDVCSALLLLLGSGLTGFWNVPLGCGEAVEVRRAVEYMHELLGSASVLHFGSIPMRDGEPDCIADITLLRSMGFEPCCSWRQGLKRLCSEIFLGESECLTK